MKILLLNQTFYPDCVSSGQYAGDLATALAAAGHEVTVLTGQRAYDRPWVRFRSREVHNGVNVVRIPYTGFGKAAPWRRALDFGSFLLSCIFYLLTIRGHDVVVAMTSPPLLSTLAAAMVRLRGGRLVCWVLDLNPDEAIAAGWLKPESLFTGFLRKASAFAYATASQIIVMDRFMAGRVAAYGVAADKITVIPPWANNESVTYDPAGREAFRHENGLDGRFVVMYSGNHSPCHPLDTLLETARRMKNDPRVAFCFIGGGSEFARVKAYAAGHRLGNILCLPYVPMSRLSASLSSADLHTVVMGEPYVGIVHTCKVYNILALGIPFLYLGPESSHIADLRAAAARASHGDSSAVVRMIRDAIAAKVPVPNEKERALALRFAQQALLLRMFEVLHRAAGIPLPQEPFPTPETLPADAPALR